MFVVNPALLCRVGGACVLGSLGCGVAMLVLLLSQPPPMVFAVDLPVVVLTLASVVAMPMLFRTTLRIARGRDADHLMRWTMIYVLWPMVAAEAARWGPLPYVAMALVLLGFVLQAVGAHLYLDWPSWWRGY